MVPAARHTLDDFLIGHVNFNHVVNRHTRGFHCISLGNGAGKAVKQKTLGTIWLCNALFYQIDDDVVGNQSPRIHDFLGRNA